jgi:hypothetical protein
MLKSPNRSCRFWGLNQKTVATSFETKTGETVATGFDAKLGEIVPVILRTNHWQTVPVVLSPNYWQTVDLDFEAQPINSCSSSSCVRCRPHTMSLDLLIARPPSNWHVLDHPHSSAPGLLLLLWSSSLPAMLLLPHAHQETSKYVSPHEIRIKVKLQKYSGFKFKHRHVNDSSQSNQYTDNLVSQSPHWWVHW